MPLQLIGPSGAIQEVDSTFKSARVSLRPAEVINWQSIGGVSGALTGVAAAGNVFSFRNTAVNPIMLRRVQVGFATTTAFTAAQALAYGMYKANGFTASDTGGTVLYTAGQNKHKLGFTNISGAPDIRIASTAALGAGTKTVETQSLGVAGGTSNAVGAVMPITPLLSHDAGDYPLILAQNEGFIINNLILMGAAGVIQLHVNIEFAEVLSY